MLGSQFALPQAAQAGPQTSLAHFIGTEPRMKSAITLPPHSSQSVEGEDDLVVGSNEEFESGSGSGEEEDTFNFNLRRVRVYI